MARMAQLTALAVSEAASAVVAEPGRCAAVSMLGTTAMVSYTLRDWARSPRLTP